VFFVAGCSNNDKNASSETNGSGEILFKNNCASCHKPDKDFTAPALKGSLQRWGGDKKAMYDFIKNPSQNENGYSLALKKKWSPALMTAFPTLSDEDLDAIMKYVEK
jgi:cytochrome c551/c552